MKRLTVAICLLLIAAIVLPTTIVQAASGGVNDLRGRWNVDALIGGEPIPDVVLYVNDMRVSAILPNTFYANGCMRSTETNAFMPLSIRAVYDAQNNAYDATIYSTVVPPEGQPFVIRLSGQIDIRGESVKDDTAVGTARTDFGEGEWSAGHHDRRETKCPSVRDIGLGVQGDVYTHLDLSNNRLDSLYEAHTIIVSSGMLVEAPDGSSFVVQEYTDLFSPDVDFVGRFRYLASFEGSPVSGGVYTFTLLDIFGDPIEGTESTDTWTGCSQTAPVNLTTNYEPGSGVTLGWDAVPDVAGEFEPMSDPQIGFYQIGVDPFNWQSPFSYGSNLIRSPQHLILWNPFEPGAAGSPDGNDYGASISEFAEGDYQVMVFAFAGANPQNGGTGHECAVYNSSHKLIMHKQGEDLTFNRIGAISGLVYDTQGNPLGGIGVDVEEGGYGACTDETGYYEMREVPFGTYTVVAGRQFCGEHPFAEEALAGVTVGSTGVNFALETQPPPSNYTIIAQPDHKWVFSVGWAVGSEITMFIDDNSDPADGYLLTMSRTAIPAEWDPAIGKVDFNDWQPFDLTPGMFVIVTDGTNTEVLQVESLAVDAFDEDLNTVSGAAPALREVGVGVHQPGADYWMVVTSDTDGNWFAQFPDEFSGVFDIHAMIWDADGDATQANFAFP